MLNLCCSFDEKTCEPSKIIETEIKIIRGLLLIDNSILNINELLKAINSDISVFLYSTKWSVAEFYERFNAYLSLQTLYSLDLVGWVFENESNKYFKIRIHEHNFQEYGEGCKNNTPEIAFIIQKLKPYMRCNFFDLISCNILNNEEYNYRSRIYIENNTGIKLRSSVDPTGNTGNWILESHDFNLVGEHSYLDINVHEILQEKKINLRFFDSISNLVNGITNGISQISNGALAIDKFLSNDVKNFFEKDLRKFFTKTMGEFLSRKFNYSLGFITVKIVEGVIIIYKNRKQIIQFVDKLFTSITETFDNIIFPIIQAFDIFGLVQLGLSINDLIKAIGEYKKYIKSNDEKKEKIALAKIIVSTIQIVICVTTLSIFIAQYNNILSAEINQKIFVLTTLILPLIGSLGDLGVKIINYIYFPTKENQDGIAVSAAALGITITIGTFSSPKGQKLLKEASKIIEPYIKKITNFTNQYILQYSFKKLTPNLPKSLWIKSFLDDFDFDFRTEISKELNNTKWLRTNIDNIVVDLVPLTAKPIAPKFTLPKPVLPKPVLPKPVLPKPVLPKPSVAQT